MCAHIFSLWGVRLIRGLPWGVSSLVECTIVKADVAAVRGYPVVSVVRPGMISCTYVLWSTYFFVFWSCDSEAVSTDSLEDVALPVYGPLTCCWTLPYPVVVRQDQSNCCACQKCVWSPDTEKSKSCLRSIIQDKYKADEFCSSTKVQEILDIMSDIRNKKAPWST